MKIFTLIFFRWLDRTRKVRLYANISIIVQIVGFLLYLVSIHPIFLLLGRTICGISDPFCGVVSGELLRIYDGKDATVAMVALSSVYAIGFMIGPALNFLFTDISFTIGPLLINYSNFIGIFMPCWLIFCLIISNFLVHDCSREFDLKEYLKKVEEEKALKVEQRYDKEVKTKNDNHLFVNNIDEKVTEKTCLVENPKQLQKQEDSTIPISTVIRILLTNQDTLLILVATVFFMYGIFAVSALQPLIVTVTLQWSLQRLSIIYLAMGSIELTLLFTLGYCVRTNRSIYFTCIVAIISQIMNCVVLICMIMAPRLLSRDVVLETMFALTLLFGYNFDDVMIKVVFSKMIPSKIQSFSESVRNGLSRISIVAGSFTVAVVLPVAHWWAVGIAVVYIVVLVGFVVRKRHLIEPREIEFEKTAEETTAYGTYV